MSPSLPRPSARTFRVLLIAGALGGCEVGEPQTDCGTCEPPSGNVVEGGCFEDASGWAGLPIDIRAEEPRGCFGHLVNEADTSASITHPIAPAGSDTCVTVEGWARGPSARWLLDFEGGGSLLLVGYQATPGATWTHLQMTCALPPGAANLARAARVEIGPRMEVDVDDTFVTFQPCAADATACGLSGPQ